MSYNYIDLIFYRIKNYFINSKKNKIYPENKQLKISKPNYPKTMYPKTMYPKTMYPNKINFDILYPSLSPIE